MRFGLSPLFSAILPKANNHTIVLQRSTAVQFRKSIMDSLLAQLTLLTVASLRISVTLDSRSQRVNLLKGFPVCPMDDGKEHQLALVRKQIIALNSQYN